LLRQDQYAAAESLLREALATHDEKQRDRVEGVVPSSLLGKALTGQGKYAEAEPLLLASYRRMVERKSAHAAEAGERIVRLYTAWGKPDEAAKWRKKLGAARSPEKGGR
jgi:hypothetical protein